jgi:hypothetical protein
LLTDIPHRPIWIILRLTGVPSQRNSIATDPVCSKIVGLPASQAGTRFFAFIKAHPCRRPLSHSIPAPLMLGQCGPGGPDVDFVVSATKGRDFDGSLEPSSEVFL